MKHEEPRFQLQLEGELIREGGLPGFQQVSHHATLRAALTALQDVRNEWFDESKVRQQGLPQLCRDARVIDLSDSTVVAAKYHIGPDELLGFNPGVYLRLNNEKIGRSEFEHQSGCILPDMPPAMNEKGYYLLAPSEKLQEKVGVIKKMAGIVRRKLKPGEGKGNRI